MVKASAGGKSKTQTGALRIDMKRKLPLPPPFVVSRGYTPDYPWLGQDHPAPKTAPRRPRLLMQQSCSGAARAAVCVVCAVLGVALILFAGNAIIRGAAERAVQRDALALHDVHDAALGGRPQHEALVQDLAEQDVVGALIPDEDDLTHRSPAPEEHLPDDGGAVSPQGAGQLRMVDPVFPEDAQAASSDAADKEEIVQAVEDGVASEGSLQATKHLLLWMRMANLVGAQREMQERVLVTEALRGAYEKLQAAEAAAADSNEGDVLVSGLEANGPSSSVQDQDSQAQPEDQREDQEHLQQQATVKDGGRLLEQWMAQAEPTEQDKQEEPQHDATEENARLLMQWMMQAQPTEQEEQGVPQKDIVDEDAPLLAQWMGQARLQQDVAQDDSQQGDLKADQQGGQRESLQGDDAEAVRQILLWLTSSPQSWDVEQPREQPVEETEQPASPAPVAPHEDQSEVRVAAAEDELPPSTATTVVPWDQLNEDDKQDALLPKLAARGVDLPQGEVTEDSAKTMVVDARSQADNDVATQVESDIHAHEPQGQLHGAPQAAMQDMQDMQDEEQQAQHYRSLVSQRFPLMYHVLHLRRSQQDALQQEQRATAYLRLLDLHLLQHQQEAEARRQQRQHYQDMLRLQQDEALWAQQQQWAQQEQQAYQQGEQSAYVQQRPVRHLHGRGHHHHHRRHQHAF